jgi:GntR family transcriptional repressor for pyruvate dehydrogenase complex
LLDLQLISFSQKKLGFIMEEIKEAVDFGIVSREVLSDKVADRILTLIKNRELKPGDRLPPERDLAVMMGVSRPIVREALRALSYMNVVENRQRAGTFITSLEPGLLVEHLDFVFSLDDSTYLELLRARKVVEPGLAEMAARYITDEEVDNLERVMEKTRESINQPEIFLNADIELHAIITNSAHNMILERFMKSIVKISTHSRRRTAALPEVRKQTVNDHFKIVAALKARDPELARQAMLNHLTNIEKRLLEASD